MLAIQNLIVAISVAIGVAALEDSSTSQARDGVVCSSKVPNEVVWANGVNGIWRIDERVRPQSFRAVDETTVPNVPGTNLDRNTVTG